MRTLTAILMGVLLAAVAGCSTVPESIIKQPTSTTPQAPVATAPANGAIFQQSAYRPMFEDRRARMAGDMLTIAISERTSAGKSSANATSKSGSVEASVPSLFGVSAAITSRATVAAESANSFQDKGSATSSNTFSGTITVTVVEVLPNGNLVVSGEKQVSLDKGVEYVRFAGIVNPDNIGAGNVVASTQVADARVEYRTNSRIDRAEMMSQLARFFLSVLPL